MNLQRFHRIFVSVLALTVCGLTAYPASFVDARALGESAATGPGAPAQARPARSGVSQTIHGVTVTLAELRARSQAVRVTKPKEASPRRAFNGLAAPTQNPSAPAGPASGSAPQAAPLGPDLPQAPVDEIFGPSIVDTIGFVPPDTMGAVGSIDFLFSVNGRFQGFTKAQPHTKVFDMDQVAFWGGVADAAGVSDGHVRYDRATQRWIITEIDVKSQDNHILLAVSSGPDLSTATWSEYALPATGGSPAEDQNCFADYDTPGIDQNAIYIGANMFGNNGAAPCALTNYEHSNLYVLQKAPTLTGSPATLTTFYNVVTGTAGIETIQGVDSFDSLSTGYAVAVDETENPRAHLDVWTISNPGTLTPTLSVSTTVPISAERGALGGVLTANNAVSGDPTRPMDDIDDRLFAAVIRDGQLWTAHNVAVNSSGNSNTGSPTRDGVRWYDVAVPGLTLTQSGTVYDGASNFLQYWMGTVMVSGQGHVAMGLNRANISTTVEAGAVGRLAGDALGTMLGFTRFQTSTADAYDDSGFVSNPANRWGDYTYTSLDPCDDMTMWTTQEYVAGSADGGVDWGVAAGKLQAPPPATLTGAGPTIISRGQSNVSLFITGTAASGSGFYDTPNTLTDPCRQRLTAAVSGNVTVTSVSYTDPLHVQLNISTVGASLGPQTVTITNPDGQAASAPLLAIGKPTTTTLTSAPSITVFGQSVAFTATVSGSGGPPTGSVTFYGNASPLGSSPLSAGVATFTTTTLDTGINLMTATFTGDDNFQMSTSAPLVQNVFRANSLTALSSGPNPSLFGQTVTFTATVSGTFGGLPTGSVSFHDGVNLLGSRPLLAGVAVFQSSSLAAGIHSLTATYSGDGNFNGSNTFTPLTQTVNPAASQTALSSGPNPSRLGQSVTFSATVSGPPGPLTGTVTFYAGAPLGSGLLLGGVATYITDTLPIGVTVITATYGGNTDYLISTSSPLSQTVQEALFMPLLTR